MSNYNWPMSLGELCIYEAQRQLLQGVVDRGNDMFPKTTISAIECSYWINKIIKGPAYFRSAFNYRRGEEWTDGEEVRLSIKTKDFHALRRLLYHDIPAMWRRSLG